MTGSLLLLLDDIATVLDDVAAMTKVAAKKTAGVIGDDLALNAKQVTGVRPARELPVVWRVARGSAINKLILVPAALAISWVAPWAITPLLVAGGAFLCYEGAEKILHRFLHGKKAAHEAALEQSVPAGCGKSPPSPFSTKSTAGNADGFLGRRPSHPDRADLFHSLPADGIDPVAVEKDRINAAVRTDFILSAEIIVITLGVAAGKPLVTQLAVLAAISVAMTIGVYGLVAAIVKLDDLGAMLAVHRNGSLRRFGRGILAAAPWLMRGLSAAGTAAMFLVGGGIIAHALPAVHSALHDLAHADWLPVLSLAADAAVGLCTGFLLVGMKAALSTRPPHMPGQIAR
jgi:predicted DNA repair protein MutK